MGWLESAVAEVLQKTLGAFVRGIDAKSLELDLGRGDVRLQNLELRTEALSSLQLPVSVLGAKLGDLRVVVPWLNLGKEPLTVHIDKLFLLVVPLGEAAAHGPTAEALAAKEGQARREQLTAWETLQDKRAASKEHVQSSFVESLGLGLMQKLQVTVRNVHVRMLSDATGAGPTAGVVFKSFEVSDADVREMLPAGASAEEALQLL
eukprot:5847769-Prymnesium_polylepis.1